VSEFFSKPIQKVISQDDIGNIDGGIINLNWRSPSVLKEFLKLIGNLTQECILIFSTGTSSGTPIKDRINSILGLCEHVFISVDSLTEDSINPAKNLCKTQSIDWKKIKFGCWKKTHSKDATIHMLAILDNEEMKSLSDITHRVQKQVLLLLE